MSSDGISCSSACKKFRVLKNGWIFLQNPLEDLQLLMRRLFAIANSVFALLGWRSAGNEEAVAHQLLWLLFNVGWRYWSLNIGKCTLAHAMVLLQIVFGGLGTVIRNVGITVLSILGSF